MAELKTRKNNLSAMEFINSVNDEQKRKDSLELMRIYEDITSEKAIMWGSSIIGFGQYHYKSDRSSQEGDWPLVGFSPRKQQLTLYFMDGFDNYKRELEKLGKHKISVGCLYLKKLEDIDINVLKQMIKMSYSSMKKAHSIA